MIMGVEEIKKIKKIKNNKRIINKEYKNKRFIWKELVVNKDKLKYIGKWLSIINYC